MLKKYNGLIGRFFECSVVAIINKENINTLWHSRENVNITTIPSYVQILKDAFMTVKQQFPDATKAIWTNNPFNDCGDVILNDTIHVELKYVCGNGSTGTYHNTSIRVLERYGVNVLPYFKKYLHPVWNKYKLNYTKNQLSLTKRSQLRLKSLSNYDDVYKEIIYQANLLDKAIRDELYTKLNNEVEIANCFIQDMLNKKKSKDGLIKGAPDFYIVFNSSNKIIKQYAKNDLSLSANENIKLVGENSILVDKNFRATVSWQNGLGIQNPTLRIFLEK